MKLALVLSFLFSLNAYSAELHLKSGDSAIIETFTRTLVTCEGGSRGGGCSDNVDGLKALVASCEKTYSGGYCIRQFWPDFKKDYPTCVYAAVPVCLEFCEKNYSGGYCSSYCK